MILGIIIAVVSILIDQITKILVNGNMELGQIIVLIPKVFQLHYVHNEGAAYGLFSNARWIFLVISAIIIIAIPFFMYKFRRFGKFYIISLSLVLGGAISNMIDRVFLGYVIDFMEPVFLPFGNFTNNFADIFVNVGAISLFVYLIFINKEIWKDDKKKRNKEAAVSEESTEQAEESNEQIEESTEEVEEPIKEENETVTETE